MFCDSLFQSEMFDLPEEISLYFKTNFQILNCLIDLILEINVMLDGLISGFLFLRSSMKFFLGIFAFQNRPV